MMSNSPRLVAHETLISSHVSNHVEKRRCKRKACRAQPGEDSDYCERHERMQRVYDKLYRQRQRQQWDAEGKCTRCGANDRKPGLKWCPACVIRHPTNRKRARSRHVNVHVENRRDRVAKRIIPWSESPTNKGRARLRGGKRGAPSMEDRDRRDLDDIRLVLADYEQALAEAYAPEVRELSRDAQRSAREAAHAGLALAVRMGMEALVRYGYEIPILHPDEIGDSDDDDDA